MEKKPLESKEKLFKIRHSAAHIMAQAVMECFEKNGPVYLAGGPPIDNGFYYDFLLPRKINEDDLTWIENRMKEIILEAHAFSRENVDEKIARNIFTNQPLN
ncbi:MAG: hypothetical protein R3B45_01235 [Bdellovibrionota bacterium]